MNKLLSCPVHCLRLQLQATGGRRFTTITRYKSAIAHVQKLIALQLESKCLTFAAIAIKTYVELCTSLIKDCISINILVYGIQNESLILTKMSLFLKNHPVRTVTAVRLTAKTSKPSIMSIYRATCI